MNSPKSAKPTDSLFQALEKALNNLVNEKTRCINCDERKEGQFVVSGDGWLCEVCWRGK